LFIDAVFHFNSTIQDSKNIFSNIDVPFVWLVSSMQACRYAAHVANL
jgi:hypothetical protein